MPKGNPMGYFKKRQAIKSRRKSFANAKRPRTGGIKKIPPRTGGVKQAPVKQAPIRKQSPIRRGGLAGGLGTALGAVRRVQRARGGRGRIGGFKRMRGNSGRGLFAAFGRHFGGGNR